MNETSRPPEEQTTKRMTRRDFLRRAAMTAAGLALSRLSKKDDEVPKMAKAEERGNRDSGSIAQEQMINKEKEPASGVLIADIFPPTANELIRQYYPGADPQEVLRKLGIDNPDDIDSIAKGYPATDKEAEVYALLAMRAQYASHGERVANIIETPAQQVLLDPHLEVTIERDEIGNIKGVLEVHTNSLEQIIEETRPAIVNLSAQFGQFPFKIDMFTEEQVPLADLEIGIGDGSERVDLDYLNKGGVTINGEYHPTFFYNNLPISQAKYNELMRKGRAQQTTEIQKKDHTDFSFVDAYAPAPSEEYIQAREELRAQIGVELAVYLNGEDFKSPNIVALTDEERQNLSFSEQAKLYQQRNAAEEGKIYFKGQEITKEKYEEIKLQKSLEFTERFEQEKAELDQEMNADEARITANVKKMVDLANKFPETVFVAAGGNITTWNGRRRFPDIASARENIEKNVEFEGWPSNLIFVGVADNLGEKGLQVFSIGCNVYITREDNDGSGASSFATPKVTHSLEWLINNSSSPQAAISTLRRDSEPVTGYQLYNTIIGLDATILPQTVLRYRPANG